MKILTRILLILLAYSNLQAQENDTLPPPIDFKEYVALMNPKMCDSIYRVDTLYYPFEGDVQMIEIRFKTVLKKGDCWNLYSNANRTFALYPSIFIFRNRNGEIINIYNNHFNFNIEKKLQQDINFTNTNTYSKDYIFIEKRNTIKNDIPKQLYDYNDNIIEGIQNTRKGLIDRKGNIKLAPIYEDIFTYKEYNSILIKEDSILYFIDYTTLKKINKNTFKKIEKANISTSYKIAQSAQDSFYYIINNRGESLLKDKFLINIKSYKNILQLINNKNQYKILNTNLKTMIDWKHDIYIYNPNDISSEEVKYFIVQNKKYSPINILDKNLQKIISLNALFGQKKIYIFKEILNRYFNLNLLILSNGPQYGIYNINDKTILDIKYKDIRIGSNYIITKENINYGNYTVYNFQFEKIIEDKGRFIKPYFGCIVLDGINKNYVLYDLDKKDFKYMTFDVATTISYDSINEAGNIILRVDNSTIELK